VALGRPVRMLPPYRAARTDRTIYFTYLSYRTLGPRDEIQRYQRVFGLAGVAHAPIVT
jgi:hypothetical protein